MVLEEPQSIWELYGLKANPFSTAPLLLEGGSISLDTFVGRLKELKRISTLFKVGNSRIVVSGEMGVGKTTFVNYARRTAIRELNFFTPIREIDVQPEWNSDDLIMNTLAMIYITIERKPNIKISETIKKKLAYLFNMLEISETSGSFNIMGTGFGVGKTTTTTRPRITTTFLRDLFDKVIKELKEQGYKKVVLHYNNLENLEQQRLINLFSRIRDFLQNEDVHFIFVGDVTVPSSLEKIPKVSSIFSDSPILLQSFRLEEIKAILGKRIGSLKIEGMRVQMPYEESAIRELNSLYKGNIRAILNSLSTAIMELINITKGKPLVLTAERLRVILKNVLKERYLSKMSPIDLQVLKVILKQGEATNKSLANRLNKRPQNISKNLSKLQKLNAIYEKKKVGAEKYFWVTPQIEWLKFEEK